MWTRISALVLGAVVVGTLSPRTAWAQACCAGATALTPARLALHEEVLVGLGVRAQPAFGSFDGGGTYRSAAGTSELGLEQSVVAAVRVLGDGQLSLSLPIVETWRRAGEASEASLGIGDLHLGARWDLLLAGERGWWPGIAVVADVGLPTGRSVDDAEKPLATDATGIGTTRIAGGLALEQVFGSVLVSFGGTIGQRFAREVGGLTERSALEWALSGAIGHVWTNGAGVALTIGLTTKGDAELDGEPSVGSATRALTLGLSGGAPIDDDWRVQAGLQILPPISGLSVNELQTAAASVSIAYAWH